MVVLRNLPAGVASARHTQGMPLLMTEGNRREIDNDECVAHYTGFESGRKILTSNALRLGRVERLCDPREYTFGWIEIDSSVETGVSPLEIVEHDNEINNAKERFQKNCRILCTCTRIAGEHTFCPIEASAYGRPRMWAQYGEKGEGLCLVLDRNKVQMALEKNAEHPRYLLEGEVAYYPWLSQVDGGASLPSDPDMDWATVNVFDLVNENGMIRSTLFMKSIDWRDESEYRWLLYSEESGDVSLALDQCLVGIVLGPNIQNRSHIETVLSYCRRFQRPCHRLFYRDPTYKLVEL